MVETGEAIWRRRVAAALIAVGLLASASFAQPVGSALQVGIPSAEMDFVAAAQQSPQWSWAAAIEMVLTYHGVAITQPQIVARTYGTDLWQPAGLGRQHRSDHGQPQQLEHRQLRPAIRRGGDLVLGRAGAARVDRRTAEPSSHDHQLSGRVALWTHCGGYGGDVFANSAWAEDPLDSRQGSLAVPCEHRQARQKRIRRRISCAANRCTLVHLRVQESPPSWPVGAKPSAGVGMAGDNAKSGPLGGRHC